VSALYPDHASFPAHWLRVTPATPPSGLAKTWVFTGSKDGGFGWWKVTVDSAGALAILSDFGNYGHHWSRRGIGERSVLQFLLTADDDYLMGKLGRRDWLDVDASVKALRTRLVEMRRDLGRAVSREEEEKADGIRELWDHLDSVSTEHDWNDLLMRSPLEVDSYDLWTCGHQDFEPQLRAFFKEVWPLVREQIRKEVEAGETNGAFAEVPRG